MQLITRLNDIIAKYDLLKHTFYQAWSAGELSRDILQRYAAQYYHQVSSFPCFIATAYAKCRRSDDFQYPINVRKVLLENLADEELHGTDHPALWMQFAEGLGISRDAVHKEVLLDETKALVDTFDQLAEQDWRDGLCALYAYESQVPGVSASKIEGLKKFYGISDEATLAFFTAHQTYDVEHSRKVAELIEKYVEPEAAAKATERAAAAQWKFLDGMCHLGGINCEEIYC